jgi:membrane-bound serine protease (ClpP class)
MTGIIVLFAVGVVLLALEVVVPGAILGIIGGLCLAAGVTVAFSQFGFEGAAIAGGAALLLAGITLYLEFVLLPRSRLARTFSMTATVAGKSQPAIASRDVIGRRTTAVTPLTPSGIVELDGRRFEAFSRSGRVPAGAQLDIVDLDNFRLIVSSTSTPPNQ